jgi:hypothetical protein
MTNPVTTGLIWSPRHDEAWSRCARRYYYIYVEPARPAGTPPPLTQHDWLERVVHDAAASAVRGLRQKEPVSLRRLAQAVERRMRAEWKANRDRRPSQPLPQVQWDGRHTPALELDATELPPHLDTLLAQAGTCLENLYPSPELEHLARAPARIQTIAQTKRIPFGDVQLELEIDVECIEPNGDDVIIDWRVDGGAPSSSRRACLALVPMREFGVEEVSVLELDLLTGRRELERVTVAAAEEARWELRQHIRDAQRALERTIARRPEAFDWTSDREQCRACAFRHRCPPGKVR